MTYTILAATWANEYNTSVILQTEIFGAVAASEVDRPDLWKQFMEWAEKNPISEYVPDPNELQPYQVARSFQYPSTTDQLDAIMKWAETASGISPELKNMAVRCRKVKDENPKPKIK